MHRNLQLFEILSIILLYKQSQTFQAFIYRVGTGTSVRPERSTAGESLTKAIIGLSKKSTSPTNTFDASAPEGIFLMKFISTYSYKDETSVYSLTFVSINSIT